jgi:hypothetical protein
MKTKSERGHGLPRTSRKRLSEGTRDEQRRSHAQGL